MSAPKWTPAQRAAIEDRGGTLLVSAAAGSGKTAVLVERAVRLITDAAHPVAADRLLIVTFTRAAAEELRGRIAVRLAAEAAAHPESAYLRRQRIWAAVSVVAGCAMIAGATYYNLVVRPNLGA